MENNLSIQIENLETNTIARKVVVKVLNKMHRRVYGVIPGAELSTSAAGDKEDGSQNQDSDQEDGQDRQQEHGAISELLALERDPLRVKKKNTKKGAASA